MTCLVTIVQNSQWYFILETVSLRSHIPKHSLKYRCKIFILFDPLLLILIKPKATFVTYCQTGNKNSFALRNSMQEHKHL